MPVPDLAPTAMFRALDELSTNENAYRAVNALDAILRERGHGSGVELQTALAVSRSSLHDWRRGETKIAPATVYRIAVIYATVPLPQTPADVDTIIHNGDHTDADTLFNLFYDEDPRTARNWLVEHRPELFPLPAHPAAAA